MSNAILRITDGTNHVNLLDVKRGFLLSDWRPAIAPFKSGGIWQSSPLVDGRRMAMRQFDNAVETFEMKLHAFDQDTAINFVQDLITLLEKAIAYWTTDWQLEPVWIEARGPEETNIRYAVIKGYTIDSVDNPYSQPFFNVCNKIAMNDFSLIVERDHWLELEPGDDTCVQINTMQAFDNSLNIIYDSFPISASGDDIYVELESQAGYSTNARNLLGVTPPDSLHCEVGLRFQNVTVPQGAVIWNAYLEVVASSTLSDDIYDLQLDISGDDVDNAEAWGDSDIDTVNLFTDYMYRKSTRGTDQHSQFVCPSEKWTGEATQYITGLEGVIQEIIDRDGWVSGNALALFMEYKTPEELPAHDTDARTFYSFDDVTYAAPILHIEYYENYAVEAGRENTCTGNTYVATKHNKAQLTHIYYHDLSLDTWSTNIMGGSPFPLQLLPTNVANGDEIYYGITTDVGTHGPFDSLVHDLYQAAHDFELTWYYCNVDGSPPTWQQLSVWGNTQLDLGSESLIHWYQPSNWDTCTVHGVTGWWVKAVVSNVGGSPIIPKQQNRDIYTILTPYVSIDSDQVPGEISALARVQVQGTERTPQEGTNMVLVSSRSLSRGLNFTPFLNFSDTQNPIGLSLQIYGGSGNNGAIIDDTTAPTGRSYQQTISSVSTTWMNILRFVLSSYLAPEYTGTYHVFLRLKTDGSPTDFRLRVGVRSSYGSATVYTEEKSPANVTDVQILDMGIITFGSGLSLTASDQYAGSEIDIDYYQNVASSVELDLYDIILMPVDEWCGLYNSKSEDWGVAISYVSVLDIDATGNPRTSRALLRQSYHGYIGATPPEPFIIAEWNRQSRGGPYLQHDADQRLWFLCFPTPTFYGGNTTFKNKYLIHVFRSSRYLSMRGNA